IRLRRLSDPACAHRHPHSFPTRRSSDLVKSARFGGADVTHSALDFTSGAGGALDILLSDKSAEASGSVRSEKDESMSGIMVALRTEEHTSELQSRFELVCRLLLDKQTPF